MAEKTVEVKASVIIFDDEHCSCDCPYFDDEIEAEVGGEEGSAVRCTLFATWVIKDGNLFHRDMECIESEIKGKKK